jgi:hypothetical protein
MVTTSCTSGTFSMTDGSSVRRQAAMIGRTEFFAP